MSVKVSVVTPTYNRADLLGETLDSVLRQTLPDFELLIIDDGSADRTKEVVEPYLADPRVRYYYQENAGEPAAVNYGWSLAQGEYFVQINSDDPAPAGLLLEMSRAMDAHPEAIVAYCDFQFVDENNAVIKTITSPDWDFVRQISDYSCIPAAPGTFLRRSALRDRKALRTARYRYINDTEMYWDLALLGDFLHVPKALAYWRQHDGQISHSRYRSIPEIIDWFNHYFSRPELPPAVLACREACRQSILSYFRNLLESSELPAGEKRVHQTVIQEFRIKSSEYRYLNLQVGDNDLIGNKFNGHNLHLLLQKRGVQSLHFVTNKASDDGNTIVIRPRPGENPAEWLLNRGEFALSGIVHLHLIHNMGFDIRLLPVMTRLKPVVLTLHDPFFFGGYCVHPGDCEKWKTQCYDCEYLDRPFSIERDTTALSFLEKKTAFQNAGISVIVASKWMEERARLSPVFAGKTVYRIPFGVDQTVFRPAEKAAVRAALGIPADELVLMFRSDKSPFKGLDLIRGALETLRPDRHVTLLMVGQQRLMNEFGNRFTLRDLGWLSDDERLARLYQAADVFLMPSRMEAFGMMAIEAMSCGTPVLAITGTALPDVIASPDCGIAVEEALFAETLQALVDDPAQLERHAEASLRLAREQYAEEIYVERMLAAYDDIIARHRPDATAERVLEQITCLSYTENLGLLGDDLYLSPSWRLTKPIRAFRYAQRMQGRRKLPALRHMREYMKNPVIDCASSQEIYGSRCWKLTAPFHRLAALFGRSGRAKQ